jgi:hypothetical protein
MREMHDGRWNRAWHQRPMLCCRRTAYREAIDSICSMGRSSPPVLQLGDTRPGADLGQRRLLGLPGRSHYPR